MNKLISNKLFIMAKIFVLDNIILNTKFIKSFILIA